MNCFEESSSLETLDADAWQLLQQAVSDRDHGWRLPAVSTMDGRRCVQRTVVLRRVEEARRQILFHTDVRSAKIRHLRSNAFVSTLFYDADIRAQLSMVGTATIHQHDSVADQLWQSESCASLRTYLAPEPPATVHDRLCTNLPSEFEQQIPSREQVEAGRHNFAAICVQADSADLLLLRSSGHLRCRFDYTGEAVLRNWVTP